MFYHGEVQIQPGIEAIEGNEFGQALKLFFVDEQGNKIRRRSLLAFQKIYCHTFDETVCRQIPGLGAALKDLNLIYNQPQVQNTEAMHSVLTVHLNLIIALTNAESRPIDWSRQRGPDPIGLYETINGDLCNVIDELEFHRPFQTAGKALRKYLTAGKKEYDRARRYISDTAGQRLTNIDALPIMAASLVSTMATDDPNRDMMTTLLGTAQQEMHEHLNADSRQRSTDKLLLEKIITPSEGLNGRISHAAWRVAKQILTNSLNGLEPDDTILTLAGQASTSSFQ